MKSNRGSLNSRDLLFLMILFVCFSVANLNISLKLDKLLKVIKEQTNDVKFKGEVK